MRGEMIEGLAHYGSPTFSGSFVKTLFEIIQVI
jgi:hypothetical protein